MLLQIHNFNHNSNCFNPKPLINPSPKPPILFFPFPENSTFAGKHLRRHISAATAAPEDQALPQSAIQRIAEKLRSLGYVEDEKLSKQTLDCDPNCDNGRLPGEIFVPIPSNLPKYRVGHTLDPSWTTPENPIPQPGAGNAIARFHELRAGVLKEKEEGKLREKKRERAPTLAELTLPEEELRRLRSVGIGLTMKLKLGKAGITEGIVNGIHERWRRNELVKIRCEDICRLNMNRTHDLLERKTGGLVIWRSGSTIILYRGTNYKYPYFLTDDNLSNDYSAELPFQSRINSAEHGTMETTSSGTNVAKSSGPDSAVDISSPPLIQGVGLPNRVRFQMPGEQQLAEEADILLEGLGPRFTDWWGYNPLPVDADLLPAIVPGYRRPFRLLPYGVKPKLTNDEMTTLKRLGRPLPCHFALGRNRKLQGLAVSIVKLWEKCEIAKIAVKRGVQNTNSELMAEELKRLTGGVLLSRDKEFIVLYRGKDFLPAAVSSAIEDRRKHGMQGAKTRSDFNGLTLSAKEHEKTDYPAEVAHGKANGQKLEDQIEERKQQLAEVALERTSTKLSLALGKKARAEILLSKLDKEELPQPPEMDKEGITEEERYMLRKVGLRMGPFLRLGRRGVFDGTVENMHLHWKYRELVKVIMGGRNIEEVHGVARTLEAESGGILVAVELVSKGYAIIMYRGKNYKRPASLRPLTLLSKREAMKRSIEAQRRESLKLHVLKLNQDIDELKLKMANDKDSEDMQLKKDLKLESLETTGQDESSVTSVDPEDCIHTSNSPVHVLQQDLVEDISSQSEVKRENVYDTDEEEKNHSSDMNLQNGHVRPSNLFLRGQSNYFQPDLSGINPPESNAISQMAGPELSISKVMERRLAGSHDRSTQLSNRERLLLRKQALRMRKQPVFAIGKTNNITGVVKAIKTHFQKHPLAIVNVKGRAKDTSVQEVIFNLEQATGAVLVSQEPSKIILYRGWGAEENPAASSRSYTKDLRNEVASRESKPVISPELISAIRLECGL